MSVLRGRVPAFITVFVCSAIMPAAVVSASPHVPLTITEAEDLALREEPGRQALLARAAAATEQAVAAGQLPDPTLRVGLANFPISGGGFTTEGMTQAQVGVRQPFPRAGARAAGTEQFRARAAGLSASADARQRDVLTDARSAWLDTYYWQRALEIITSSRPFFEDLVTITRSTYAVGRRTQQDVLRAELELSRLDDRLIEADRAQAEARAELSRWLGQDAYRPVARALPNWEALPLLEDLRQALESHPSLLSADADVTARQAAVDLAEENKKPGWALDVGYGYRDGFLPNGEPRSDFVSVAVVVDLPFFDRNRQDRKLTAALRERSAAVDARAELRARLLSRLDREYARWSDLTRRIALYETQILGQSQGQAEATLLAYQNDRGDFAEVMRAYISDLNTRIDHVRLRVDRARSYAVLANLGGLPR